MNKLLEKFKQKLTQTSNIRRVAVCLSQHCIAQPSA